MHRESRTIENHGVLDFSRREFFSRFADGLHGSALAWLLGSDLFSANPSLAFGLEDGRGAYDLEPKPSHFPSKAVENRVSVHDFHATMLHLLGMNYRDLVYQRHGLNERFTDQFPARVISEILV